MPEVTSDLFVPPPTNKVAPRHIYTVSEITQDIKVILESNFHQVWVEGEISNFRPSSAGHFYFSLKDKEAVLSGVIFIRIARQIKFKIEDGLKVICCGKIDVYAARGSYQLIIESIEPQGIGGLQLALEQLKQKLEKEGLFRPERKRPLPYLPSRVGVVTSLSGAAIKDILQVLERRFSDVNIILSPVQVQGEGAKEQIGQAIRDLNRYNDSLAAGERIEVLIVGRGGGSIEDLWAFNEEVVARAIYASRIPVISAVGHERDVTIADLVADVRAATPSVAAELVLPKKEDLEAKIRDSSLGLQRGFGDIIAGLGEGIDNLFSRLLLIAQHQVDLACSRLSSAAKKLLLLNPAALIPQRQAQLKDLARQSWVQIGHFLQLRRAVLNKAAEKLDNLSPLNILGRGYSITFKMPEGIIMKEARALGKGDVLKTKLHQGEVLSQVVAVDSAQCTVESAERKRQKTEF